mmetsp:Transcript_78480/g.163044  ORF Transcript_78480/g.163044 Transcript_78480/m.163044 type:complete len:212 (-) Transcript_78480:1307-1942(-)
MVLSISVRLTEDIKSFKVAMPVNVVVETPSRLELESAQSIVVVAATARSSSPRVAVSTLVGKHVPRKGFAAICSLRAWTLSVTTEVVRSATAAKLSKAMSTGSVTWPPKNSFMETLVPLASVWISSRMFAFIEVSSGATHVPTRVGMLKRPSSSIASSKPGDIWTNNGSDSLSMMSQTLANGEDTTLMIPPTRQPASTGMSAQPQARQAQR